MSTQLPSLVESLTKHQLLARKSLGQHFLIDPSICRNIAKIPGDLKGCNAVEVGPGPGGLTRALLESNAEHVYAVEIDSRAWPLLEELEEFYPKKFTLIKGDAMKTNISEDIRSPKRLIANLPYNIASPLLVGWLAKADQWLDMTLMFQKEVAQRICAATGTDNYGRLSVICQWRADCKIKMTLPPGSFSPPPRVHSAVAHIIPKPETPSKELFKTFENVTRLAFGQRRKMLRQSLSPIGGTELLEEASIEPTRRPETLSPTEFETLAKIVLKRQK